RRQRRDQLVRAGAFNSDPRHETEIKQSRRRSAAHGLGANVAIVRAQRPDVETAIHHVSTSVWPDRTATIMPMRTSATATSQASLSTPQKRYAEAEKSEKQQIRAAGKKIPHHRNQGDRLLKGRAGPEREEACHQKTPPIPMQPINTAARSAIATMTIIGRASE